MKRVLYEESLRGHSVIDSAGRVIGEVVGQVVDVEQWQVEALRVRLNRAATDAVGAAHGMFRAALLDVPTAFVQGVTDTVVLKGPIDALRTPEGQPEEQLSV